MARLRQRELPQRILLPTAGGPHTALALRVATALAKSAPRGAGTVTLLYVGRPGDGTAAAAQWWAQVAPLLQAIDTPIGTMVIHSTDVTAAISQAAVEFDAVVLGATREPLFERMFFGTIPELVAARCARTVITVKSAPPPLASSVRRIAQMLSSPPSLTPTLAPAVAATETVPTLPMLLPHTAQIVELPSSDAAYSSERTE